MSWDEVMTIMRERLTRKEARAMKRAFIARGYSTFEAMYALLINR